MSRQTIFHICALILSSAMICYTCNQAVCGSIVSKCLITESCKCDLKTCNCCKECFFCLSYLYDECCSCVDLCPKPNVSGNRLSSKSHVEDLSEPVPGLFQALTMDPDPQERWRSFSFPVDFDVSFFNAKTETKFQLRKSFLTILPPPLHIGFYSRTRRSVFSFVDTRSEFSSGGRFTRYKDAECVQRIDTFVVGNRKRHVSRCFTGSDATGATSNLQQSDIVTLNCTVAYLAQCGSWNKCQATCQSMGATSYRWFHDGCCECIGDTCINYGINESRCTLCKRPQEKEADQFQSQEYDDYGEEGELADDYV